jgi:hypothetical protein
MVHLKKSAQKLGSTHVAGHSPHVAADLRGTGHQDLFIANDYGISELFFNDGKQFREVGKKPASASQPRAG